MMPIPTLQRRSLLSGSWIPPAFRSSATASNAGSVTTHTVNVPTGVQPGDLLVAAIVFGSAVAAVNITDPAGWTRIDAAPSGVSSYALVWLYRIADGTEGASYAWTTTTAMSSTLAMLAYMNPSASPAPVHATTENSPTSLTGAAPSVVATKRGLLLCAYGLRQLATCTADPTMVKRIDQQGGGRTLCVAEQVLSGAGATGAKTATLNATTVSLGFSAAFGGL